MRSLARSDASANAKSPWLGRARALSFAAVAALCTLGCPTPPTPSELASEAARDLNLSARWGQIDMAAARTSPEARNAFFKNRSGWGRSVRVIDTELAGLSLSDSSHAVIQVDVSWVRLDDTTLRITRIEQKWEDAEGKWQMKKEARVGGDLGLFGEPVEAPAVEARPPAQFPTRVIR
jgi:hypothetical protein